MDPDADSLNISQEDISRLSPTDQRDLQTFIQNENQKANVQRSESASFHLTNSPTHHSSRVETY